MDGRNVLRPTEEIPDLTDKQVGQAMAVIPADYWQLNCWSCRSPGHSTFTCPNLSVKQRIYFAYCYYLHQVRANPILKQWFQQKRSALQGKGPEPGPRPSQGREYNRTQRSAHPNAQRRGSQRQVHLIDQPQVIEEEDAVELSPPAFVGPGGYGRGKRVRTDVEGRSTPAPKQSPDRPSSTSLEASASHKARKVRAHSFQSRANLQQSAPVGAHTSSAKYSKLSSKSRGMATTSKLGTPRLCPPGGNTALPHAIPART